MTLTVGIVAGVGGTCNAFAAVASAVRLPQDFLWHPRATSARAVPLRDLLSHCADSKMQLAALCGFYPVIGSTLGAEAER